VRGESRLKNETDPLVTQCGGESELYPPCANPGRPGAGPEEQLEAVQRDRSLVKGFRGRNGARGLAPLIAQLVPVTTTAHADGPVLGTSKREGVVLRQLVGGHDR